ncbi:MAG: cytochrome ubiquinol oxidase subunit I [Candidatus Aquirickettsiella gammari]|jgi:cytochrome d ubiquinol oxidase subunit I|uniref:Cytochrome ubiquinol oxidase subunit I n=1 Tax=Candidatus Aquirickettsiella gammari TaxID=2016198 RepID=A0A370CJS2_9COXI|nr:MAG: cytochrome ubiquinol oxidase subunit I [Candidatus Aquirickettsiella gammari]
MIIDTTMLSRIQFGFTVGFHILFPTFTIGLAVFLSIMEGIWLKTGNPIYLKICQFWTKIFALTFGMGVVSGIVLAYELGTNFGPFINIAGGVIGALFVYEVLAAFFLEAGFLGVMLFGWDKVSPKLHYVATIMVALGTLFSALGILSANSWMQTPTGFHIEAGRYVVDSWWAVIFNPSTIPRFLHMAMASLLTTCFAIAGVSAWYLLKGRHLDIAKPCFSFVLGAAVLIAPMQVFLGDIVGLKIYEYQPLKTAAIEGNWRTQKGAPLILFAIPNSQQEKNYYEISIPKLASLINTHHWDGKLLGLKSVPPSERPVVGATFWMFRVMVGIGFLFLFVALFALWRNWRGQLYSSNRFYRLCILIAPLGFLSTIAGWMVAESGRQPWIVYNLINISQGASIVPFHQVFISLILLIVVYGIIFSFYLFYLFKLIRKGPTALLLHESVADVITETPFKYLAPEGK